MVPFMLPDSDQETLAKRLFDLSHEMAPIPTALRENCSSLRPVQAVLWDVYGTLFASASGDVEAAGEAAHAAAFGEAFASCGWALPEDQVAQLPDVYFGTIARFHARSKQAGVPYPEVDIREVWREILQQFCPASPLEDARLEQLAVEAEARLNPVWPMPGCQAVLKQLASEGWLMGIVSNAQFYTPLLFRGFFGSGLSGLGFDGTLCHWSWECGHGKPSTRMFVEARNILEQKGVAAGQVLFVGNDKLKDLYPAREMGFQTMLFAGDKRSLRLREGDPRCCGWEPDAVVLSLDAVHSALRQARL
jgi:putative hydrolase of the HAD superfamily